MKDLLQDSDQGELAYQKYHAKRFSFMFSVLDSIKPFDTVLEIGPYVISHHLTQQGYHVDSLGYKSPKLITTGRHTDFDIESISSPGNLQAGNYDVVICCEVIEHLRLDLNLIFRQLSALAKPGGHVVIQTPNAVALKNRVSMLFGRNPFEMIRDDYRPGGSGHLREFTMKELLDYAAKNSLVAVKTYCKNYFDFPSLKGRLYTLISSCLPSFYKNGITIVFRKEDPRALDN